MHAFSRLPVPAEAQKPATRSSMVQEEVPCSPAGAYLAIRPQRSPTEAHEPAKVRHDAEVALRALPAEEECCRATRAPLALPTASTDGKAPLIGPYHLGVHGPSGSAIGNKRGSEAPFVAATPADTWPSLDGLDDEDGAADEAWDLDSVPALSDETEPLGWLSDADLVSFGPVDGGDADWFPWIPNEDDQLLDITEPEGWMLDADWSDIPFVGGAADPFLSWFSDADEWLSETSEPEGWLADVHWSDSPTLKVQKPQVAASGDASEDSEDDGDGAASECSRLDDETAPDGWFEDLPGSLDPINVDPAEDSWFLDVDGLEDRSAGGVAIHSTLVSAGSSGGARAEIDWQLAEILALASDPGQPIVPGPVDVEVGVDIADANGERVEQAPLDSLPLREILRLPMGEARTQALRQRPRDANRSGRSAVALKLFVWVVNRREEPPDGLEFDFI
ncbi:hypothetical protein BDZ88DRAFT_162246 [Geranomyces variabilis]|nr:hypothetical protein BDZ88DRAFT_162246 [Geranomyces variabilis]KAJ3133787.1 hypothetical protein HDU90_005625 [Geranomyces variabilis]